MTQTCLTRSPRATDIGSYVDHNYSSEVLIGGAEHLRQLACALVTQAGTVPMEIEVVSDPAWAVYQGADPPLIGAAHHMADHDEQLTKPALLYADKVTLRSGSFLALASLNEHLVEFAMPLKAVIHTMAQLSNSGIHESLINEFDIPSASLISPSEAAVLFEDLRKVSHQGVVELVRRQIDQTSGRLEYSIDALRFAIHEEASNLFDSNLSEAEQAGILSIKQNSPVPLNTARTVGEYWDGEHAGAFMERELDAMISLLRDSSAVLMLDPGSARFAPVRESPSTTVLQTSANFGVSLLGQLPQIRKATVAEILDLREELAGPLTRFRGAMVEAAKDSGKGSSDSDLAEHLKVLQMGEIEPALLELDELIAENSYTGELLKRVTDPAGIATATGSLIVAATASGVPPVQLIASVLGLGIPAVRAYVGQRSEEMKIQRHKFYILNRLGQH